MSAEARPIALYVDGQEESKQALKLLGVLGIPLDIEWEAPRTGEIFPTAVYRSGLYIGLEKIHVLKDSIEFDSRQ
jgi:hypothetical protein